MNCAMWLEELKDEKKSQDTIVNDELIEKYFELDKKIEGVLYKIKRRKKKREWENFLSSK
jgi:hypothetical protein